MNRSIRNSLLGLLFLFLSFGGYSQTNDKPQLEPTLYKGSIEYNEVYCPSLEGNLQGNPTTQNLKVYLPPGYENFPNNQYPVIYLLHGYPGGFDTFNEIPNKVDELISLGKINPMIIVIPMGMTPFGGSWFTNSYVSGNWEDYIVQDVLRYIDSNYNTLNEKNYRALGGYSHGAYGAINIAMKNPSKFNAIGLYKGGMMDITRQVIHNEVVMDQMLAAAKFGSYAASTPNERWLWGCAAAFAPDSTDVNLCRLPYTSDGELIDSIWQRWLEHDPVTMLQSYKDSLLKIDTIEIFTGEDDFECHPNNVTFHQALLDHGIKHGFTVLPGGHGTKGYAFLNLFSENLVGVLPTIKLSSDYYLENTDTLVAETNRDAELYIVPSSTEYGIDSIYKYQLAAAEVPANGDKSFLLQQLEYGKYQVYAIIQDSLVSNVPAEFIVVPDKSVPQIVIEKDSVAAGDPFTVSLSRNGTLCLVSCGFLGCDTLITISEILKPSTLKDSTEVLADLYVNFETDDLYPQAYMIYGFDRYGIVSEPIKVEVLNTVSTAGGAKNHPEIKITPNPSVGIFNLWVNHSNAYFIDITSQNGQLLLNKKMAGTTRQIDLSSFQSGVYFITIRSEDFVTTRKIIKL